ncbi:hypothetical protein ACIBJE_22950 [Micromonospora sp. NPDC050187]|uniref:hypothetical protein n=1 Tax=Micromonospora sp. NPDC050187 TaxID=3364277 RepID=UPI0037A5A1AF
MRLGRDPGHRALATRYEVIWLKEGQGFESLTANRIDLVDLIITHLARPGQAIVIA